MKSGRPPVDYYIAVVYIHKYECMYVCLSLFFFLYVFIFMGLQFIRTRIHAVHACKRTLVKYILVTHTFYSHWKCCRRWGPFHWHVLKIPFYNVSSAISFRPHQSSLPISHPFKWGKRKKKYKLNLCLLCNNFRRVFPVCNLPLVIRIFSKYYNLTHWYFSLL